MITVMVTATGGGDPEEYKITVTRAMSPATDATLRSLSLSGGATLDPKFAPANVLVHGLGRPRCGVHHGHGYPQRFAGHRRLPAR